MKEDHANMPGMGNQAKEKPEQKAAAPQQAQPAKKPDASAQPDKTKPKTTPKTP